MNLSVATVLCNRHYAENAGYWLQTSFLNDEAQSAGDLTFYDSVREPHTASSGEPRGRALTP